MNDLSKIYIKHRLFSGEYKRMKLAASDNQASRTETKIETVFLKIET